MRCKCDSCKNLAVQGQDGYCNKHYPPNQRKKQLKSRYGISVEEYNRLLALQGGGCAICGKQSGSQENFGKTLAVDHDHVTGAVRGLLCSSCNTGLGNFFDKIDLLIRAVGYLGKK